MVRNCVLIVLLLIILSSGMCQDDNENYHSFIFFENLSEKTVYVNALYDYPDSVFYKVMPNPIKNSFHPAIKPNHSSERALSVPGRDCHENFFNLQPDSKNDVMIYIFDKEVLENYEWEEVGKNYLVLQRYDLTLEDLRYLDWKLTYPPSEEMRYMKMYPPYPEE